MIYLLSVYHHLFLACTHISSTGILICIDSFGSWQWLLPKKITKKVRGAMESNGQSLEYI